MAEKAGKQTILLVEDEILVAGAQKKALEKFDYRVFIAETGEDAVALFRSTPRKSTSPSRPSANTA